MDWEVSGTHKGTGKPTTVIVPGETEDAAMANAAALGLTVMRATQRTGFMLVPMTAAAAPSPSGARPRRGSLCRTAYLTGAVLLLGGSVLAMVGGFKMTNGGSVGRMDGADMLGVGILAVALAIPMMIVARIGSWWVRR